MIAKYKRKSGVLVPTTHADKLRELRDRAGLTARELARLISSEERTAGATTIYRYENSDPKFQGDRPISIKHIKRIMPYLVGKGSPPVSEDELIGISDIVNVPSLLKRAAERAVETSVMPRTKQPDGLLPLRYRAERGVFLDESTAKRRKLGSAPMAALPEFPPDDQFAVLIGDQHAEPKFSQGTILHVVVGHLPMFGRSVVIATDRASTGLIEVTVSSDVPKGARSLGVVVAAWKRL